MDEGVFTLLFIGFMILVSVMDAVGRKRKKQRRMEEMESAEADPENGREPWRERSSDAPAGTTAAERAPAREKEARKRVEATGEESAESMLPEDFWAILTGQPRPQPGPSAPDEGEVARESSARREREGDRPLPEADERGRRSAGDPPAEPRIPVPVPGDRMSTGRAGADAGRPTRRSARWMEGVESGRDGNDPGDAIREEEARVYAGLDEPWGELEDITAGDLTTGDAPLRRGGEKTPSRRRSAYDKRGPDGPASHYTRLLESGSVDDLRKAIVLREVLGRPVAFREDIGRSWME